jgi:hypothetical protein
MKKVININLSGRVIPIEETAFEKLKTYIESLRHHFKDEEGRDEIINDIENRIAELLEQDIKKGSACITDQKIDDTIHLMGRVEDFIEMDAGENTTSPSGQSTQEKTSGTENVRGSLFRNSNDKIIAGVCSGVAHALRIDPVVVRVLFALFLLGGGSGLIIYIILWVVMPEKPLAINIQKKFFRNSDKKMIAGVASGLAAYFNIPVWIPRLIFLLPIIAGISLDFLPSFIIGGGLGGTFFITYIILWMVVPYAKTPSDKMQMRGEKIDVNSIKNAVKDELGQLKTRSAEMGEKLKTGAEQMSKEATTVAGTTFGRIFTTLIKIFFIFLAGILVFAGMVIAGALGVASLVTIPVHGFLLSNALQEWVLWGTILLFLITPVVGIIIWLIRRIIGAKTNKYISLSFVVLWILGWISLGILTASIGKEFKQESVVATTITNPLTDSSVLQVSLKEPIVRYTNTYGWINSDETGFDITKDSLFYHHVTFIVEKSDSNQISADVMKYSFGTNKKTAQERAGHISFDGEFRDSTLLLSSALGIDKKSKYRGQHVQVILRLPVGKKIRFDEKLIDLFEPEQSDMNEDGDYGIRHRDVEYESGVEYIMTEQGLQKTGSFNKKVGTTNDVVKGRSLPPVMLSASETSHVKSSETAPLFPVGGSLGLFSVLPGFYPGL